MSSPRTTEAAVEPLFTERWSPRSFTGEAIDRDTLMGFFEAARWAPSASNMQPWRFIFGTAGTPAFTAILESLVPFNQDWAKRASALVVVLSATQGTPPGKTEPSPNPTHAFDTGAAWMNLALQAHLAGWHTHAMGGFLHDVARRNLAVPEDHALHAVVAIGRRGDKVQLPEALQARELPNGRQPLARMVAEGRFGFGA